MTFQKFLSILGFSLLVALPAQAAKIPMFFSTGDELFTVADFPAEILKENPGAKDLKAGYKCSHFALFGADVWTWDCKLVGVSGEKSYSDLPSDLASKLAGDPAYGFSKAERGFWNKYAFWGLIGAFLLYLGVSTMMGKTKENTAPA